MELSLLILAAVGFAAVLRCLLRAAFRAARHGAYVLYAREIAATRSRRGDLTGLEEAREWAGQARKDRRQALGGVGFWLALLFLPLALLPRPVVVYATYAAIWLIPSTWRRGRTAPGVGRSRGGRP
jgi:hypothetical protein